MVAASGIADHRRFLHHLEIRAHHFGDQFANRDLVRPAELFPRLGGVADQQFDLGRPEIARIDLDQDPARRRVETLLLDAGATPFDRDADIGEGPFDKGTNGGGDAGREHIVVGLVLLQHHPHRPDIFAGMAPVALGIEVAEIELVLPPERNRGDRPGDLAGDEGLAADRALVVEQDAVRGVDAIGLAIVHRDPVGVELGGGVGRAGIEGCRLGLGNLLDLAVELGGRRLVEACLLLQAKQADRLEQPQRPQRIGIGRVFGRLEADHDMRLRGEIVDLVRLGLLDDADQVGRIGHVAVVEDEALVGLVRLLVEVLDPPGVERRRPPLDAVDDVALFEEELGQIGAVLAGHAGDQGDFVHTLECQTRSLRGRLGRTPV